MLLSSMEDFDKEMAAFEADRLKNAKPAIQNLPKKTKKILEPSVLEAELVAKEEIGSFNWVGQLLG